VTSVPCGRWAETVYETLLNIAGDEDVLDFDIVPYALQLDSAVRFQKPCGLGLDLSRWTPHIYITV
jgi:hypothetical protein